jgi:hypothetical protein
MAQRALPSARVGPAAPKRRSSTTVRKFYFHRAFINLSGLSRRACFGRTPRLAGLACALSALAGQGSPRRGLRLLRALNAWPRGARVRSARWHLVRAGGGFPTTRPASIQAWRDGIGVALARSQKLNGAAGVRV